MEARLLITSDSGVALKPSKLLRRLHDSIARNLGMSQQSYRSKRSYFLLRNPPYASNWDVRFGSKADLTASNCDFRYTPGNGHGRFVLPTLLAAQIESSHLDLSLRRRRVPLSPGVP